MPWEASLALSLLQLLLPFFEKLLHGDTATLGTQPPIPEAEVLPRMQHFLEDLTAMAQVRPAWDAGQDAPLPEAEAEGDR
jgi:hypothetical protein